jgi:hypothetical protein
MSLRIERVPSSRRCGSGPELARKLESLPGWPLRRSQVAPFATMEITSDLPALSADYARSYERLLAAVGARSDVEPDELALFWPMVGHAYRGELLVVGRAVNGWIDRVIVEQLRSADERIRLTQLARQTSLGDGSCPMGWVTWRWGRGGGEYSTARSAFWRHIRAVLASVDPASRQDADWSSRLAWSNLAKLAPWAGGNPGGSLLDVQRSIGPELLRREVADLAPKRILVLTGRWWFEPFAEALGLRVEWRDGLVAGVADEQGRRWVIAAHPQGKPRSILEEVVAAFAAAAAGADSAR